MIAAASTAGRASSSAGRAVVGGVGGVSIALLHDRIFPCVQVRGESMAPTFAASGERLLLDRPSAALRRYARGDVVVARSPEQEGVLIVKRVVGLPGDVLLTRDGRREAVPSDAVFLEGDNALNSNDSNAFGSVPASSIHARARLRIWPPSKAGVVDRVEPSASRLVSRASEVAQAVASGTGNGLSTGIPFFGGLGLVAQALEED